MSANGKRILVVDDEPSIVDAVATALRYEGYDVEESLKGRDALRFFSTIAVNSFAKFDIGQAKHIILCNSVGKIMGEGVLMKHAEERAQSVQNRIADRITAFAGSMWFVYIHIIWFSSWIGFGVEGYPYGLLTMIVSLEAIFLSTFVMISQNRADAKRQVLADSQWQTVKEEDKQNKELLDLSNQILELTKAIHAHTSTRPEGTANP